MTPGYLVEKYFRRAETIGVYLAEKWPVELSDAKSIASWSLFRAAGAWSAESGTDFHVYLFGIVQRDIIDDVRNRLGRSYGRRLVPLREQHASYDPYSAIEARVTIRKLLALLSPLQRQAILEELAGYQTKLYCHKSQAILRMRKAVGA
jgi:DNA-directed RNA polymerase specialized sigma24 family protein